MEEEHTCGKGLAHHSVLPARMADVITGMARMLTAHRAALDPAEPEDAAYARIAAALEKAAEALRRVAADMEAQRTLPMGSHDVAQLMAPESTAAFAAWVSAEGRLVSELQAMEKEHRAMLESMQPTSD